MKRLKALWYSFDPYPATWQAAARLGLVLLVVETLAALAFIYGFEALI